ncbi:MAG: universal stress protein [Nitrospirota bacterium]
MDKILIAVDDTKGIKKAFPLCGNICTKMNPESVVLVYVEKFEGRSLIDEMLGDAELSTLKEALEGTEYQEALDRKAQGILDYYQKALEKRGVNGIKTVVRKGHPAEEILKTAKKEKVGMIIVGSRGRRASHLFMGSVSREVANNADVPVLIVR